MGGGVARAFTYIIQTRGLMSEDTYPYREGASWESYLSDVMDEKNLEEKHTLGDGGTNRAFGGQCRLHNNDALHGPMQTYVNVSGGNETLLVSSLSHVEKSHTKLAICSCTKSCSFCCRCTPS